MEEHKCMCGGNCACGNKMNSAESKENGNRSEEEKEIEIFEFSLNEEEINELIVKLVELKQTKGKIDFEVDDDNDLLIHYDEEESEEGEE